MNHDPTPARGDIFRRIERIERHPAVLDSLLSPIAQRSGQNVEMVVAAEAASIYADALACPSFTSLDLAAIKCRSDCARLAVIKARPGSPVAGALAEARHDLVKIERAIRQADSELLRWVVARLKARGWPAWSTGIPDVAPAANDA